MKEWKTINNKFIFTGQTKKVQGEEDMLKERLISRKEKGGLSREEAVAWYQNSDSKNVKRVLKDSCRKHLNLLLQVEQDNDYLQVK